ncbi:MAG: type II secretion system protein [Candidatus Omnitrophota bacterium]|nr:MAG: type II secretion system protein [Candidatus Omnitrophota bacterium]
MRIKRGFTLIELLISITIFSMVGAAVYSVFANGIAAWRRGNKNRTYARNIRLTSEKLARDLRNTFEFSNIAFEGTEDSIKFPALVEVVEKAEGSEAEESHYEVGRLSFFYDDEKKALCREAKTYPEVFAEDEDEEDDEDRKGEVLIERVRELEFEYCYLDNATGTYQWKEDWKKEEQDTIAQAVKIKMAFDKKTEQDDFEKTIFIPIGTGRQKITLGK